MTLSKHWMMVVGLVLSVLLMTKLVIQYSPESSYFSDISEQQVSMEDQLMADDDHQDVDEPTILISPYVPLMPVLARAPQFLAEIYAQPDIPVTLRPPLH